jgi:SpoVK/Ycf46/Vps4 family AAA+-type ATPase
MSETLGQKMAAEVSALIRARCSLLWVVTPEEGRVERALVEAVARAKYDVVRFWDCANGVSDVSGKEQPPGRMTDPDGVFQYIRDSKQRAVWIFRDLHRWLQIPTTLRGFRSLARQLQTTAQQEARVVIVVSPSADVPPELQDHAAVLKWPLPDRAEIAAILDEVVRGSNLKMEDVAPNGAREAAIEAAVGLSAELAALTYARSLVTQGKKIIPSAIAAEKKRVINREKGIEWFDPDPRGLDALGGLEVLKPWLVQRKAAFSERARAFGLPPPKGLFLVGVSGCGKSLTAKACAAAWQVPLLRLDLGGMQSKWVGESQANIRASLAVAEAVGNCVVWIDEIEKSLAGATGGAADGGVSSDALGTLLQWMQERKGGAFVIATSNDVSKLPPELLRKGRFDEMFFVDLPTRSERAEILRVTLGQYGRKLESEAVTRVAELCADFTGAEIAAIVPDALYAAFADGERELSEADLFVAAKAVVPLAKTAADKVEGLRKWAEGRARRASLADEGPKMDGARSLDL